MQSVGHGIVFQVCFSEAAFWVREVSFPTFGSCGARICFELVVPVTAAGGSCLWCTCGCHGVVLRLDGVRRPRLLALTVAYGLGA